MSCHVERSFQLSPKAISATRSASEGKEIPPCSMGDVDAVDIAVPMGRPVTCPCSENQLIDVCRY